MPVWSLSKKTMTSVCAVTFCKLIDILLPGSCRWWHESSRWLLPSDHLLRLGVTPALQGITRSLLNCFVISLQRIFVSPYSIHGMSPHLSGDGHSLAILSSDVGVHLPSSLTDIPNNPGHAGFRAWADFISKPGTWKSWLCDLGQVTCPLWVSVKCPPWRVSLHLSDVCQVPGSQPPSTRIFWAPIMCLSSRCWG